MQVWGCVSWYLVNVGRCSDVDGWIRYKMEPDTDLDLATSIHMQEAAHLPSSLHPTFRQTHKTKHNVLLV